MEQSTKKTDFETPSSKPEIEINKPSGSKPWRDFWQKPSSTLWVYLLFILISMYLWQGAQQAQQAEIPYSEFLQHLDKGEISEAVVTEKIITGTLTEKDPKTNQPRHFFTIALWNNDLAHELEQKGVKYKVRESSLLFR